MTSYKNSDTMRMFFLEPLLLLTDFLRSCSESAQGCGVYCCFTYPVVSQLQQHLPPGLLSAVHSPLSRSTGELLTAALAVGITVCRDPPTLLGLISLDSLLSHQESKPALEKLRLGIFGLAILFSQAECCPSQDGSCQIYLIPNYITINRHTTVV